MWWNQRRPEIVEDFEREVLRPCACECAESDLDGRPNERREGRRDRPLSVRS